MGSGKNVLTASPEEAQRILSRRRMERTEAYKLKADKDKERLEVARNMDDRKVRVLRALLKSGDKDALFSGFNGDAVKWAERAERDPDEWMWVRAKYGIMGVPYPDGSEYCFPPGYKFPLYREYFEVVHNAMSGEVREVSV